MEPWLAGWEASAGWEALASWLAGCLGGLAGWLGGLASRLESLAVRLGGLAGWTLGQAGSQALGGLDICKGSPPKKCQRGLEELKTCVFFAKALSLTLIRVGSKIA